LALDLGKKRIGVAVSHGFVAEPLPALDCEKLDETIARLQKIIEEQKVEKVVIGLPLKKGDRESEQSLWTKQAAKEIMEKLKLPCEFVNEAYSTFAARDNLDIKKIKNKGEVDSHSAKIILEQYIQEKNADGRGVF